MKISPDVFNDMTPAEFYYAWAGWSKMQVDRERNAWERQRWSTYFLLMVQCKSENQPQISQLLALPWDKKDLSPIRNEITMEERKAIVNEMLKCLKNGREKNCGSSNKDRS